MDDARDLLIETFEAHQPPTPDSLDVLTNVDAIARARRRSRWALRATGVSLLSAGIVAGSLGVSGLVSQHAGRGSTAIQVGTAGGTPTPGAQTSTPTEAQALAAYFNAGYDYTNAEQLAKIWNEPNKWPTKVKAEAGLKLLNGESLPVQPNATPATPEDKDVLAFFNAGYDYNDAVTLAGMWHESTYQAKIDGGKKLAAGTPLPIQPAVGDASATPTGSATPAAATLAAKKALLAKGGGAASKPGETTGAGTDTSPGNQAEYSAYFDAGYTYDDAVALGKIWKETDISQVKAEAGQKLLDGDTLPVKPSGTPAPPEDLAVSAFFNAGYDYNDAVKLGQMWNESPSQAKIDGGQKLENGQSLPIKPRG